jgi:hypothetical protein
MTDASMKYRIVFTLCAAALLTACASARDVEQKQKEALARYQPYLGETVSQFNRYTRNDSWTAVDNERVIVHTNMNDAYMLTVAPPCMNLPFANLAIGVTERIRNTVASGFDSILVQGERCLILKIQRLDYKRMQQDLAAQKKASP